MIKCGIDLVLNKRMEKNLFNSNFISKVFHASELKLEKRKLTGIFCLKEAVMKIMGGKLDWKEIEVVFEKSGKPKIKVSGGKFKSIDASISHDGEYTIGMVVCEL